ncbi:4'-phosphopantetheinyl transferase [Advenella kashmirensis W13003]|uniref:4'-phosphopantetheinyl transferase n=2 Tax=Advenella kashmirensis TaxID=310575 RepID=V8QWA4_9BURK|nr:4'-phosphopantetheinyl transferase [Advenella kashmirensis W13003]
MPFFVSDSGSPAPMQLWFAGPALQAEYDPQALTAGDRARETARLAGRNAHEWRVSRALQRRLLIPYRSSNLSHSDGHALWAASSIHAQIGVDLERMKSVDELALAELVSDEQELALLRCLQGQCRTRLFYRLWTLKEALVKAAGGDFPADMFKVGIRRGSVCATVSAGIASRLAGLPDNMDQVLPGRQADRQNVTPMPVRGWQLVGLGNGPWCGLSAMIDDDWMMAVVWPGQGLAGKQGAAPLVGAAQHDSASAGIVARQAVPGHTRPLTLAQAVCFYPESPVTL